MTVIRVTTCSLLLAFSVVSAPRAFAQPPTRDAAKPAPVGTATLAGRVVSDDAEARPVRRVRVGITTSDRQVGRTTVTDDEGPVRFRGPSGRALHALGEQAGLCDDVLRSQAAKQARDGARAR